MRVLWLTGNFRPQLGGLENYVERMVGSLASRIEVGLMTEDGQGPAPTGCVAHLRAPPFTWPRTPTAFHRLGLAIARAVACFHPQIVHLSNASVAAYRSFLPRALPVVATVHGNDLTAPWQQTPGRDPARAIASGLDECERIFAVSRHTEALVRRSGVRAPASVIWPGCDADFFRPGDVDDAAVRRRHRIPAGVPVVLTVARLVPRKGHTVMLDAITRLPYDARWIVVGDGPSRGTFEEAVARSPAPGRVTMVGRVSNDELLTLYRASDVFVMTPETRVGHNGFDSEGFGLVFLEAGACGRPVIASNTSGCRDAVVHGETGLLVPPSDAGTLAAAIRRILEDRALARALGEAGRRRALSGGWAAAAEKVVEVYGNVVLEVQNQRELTAHYRL
jgi:phosphatidyl-myo-inositol dimannoside synthase